MIPETILIDIDGVVAQKNLAMLLPLYNEYFNLDLSSSDLQSLHSIDAFEELQEVQKFRERVGETRYNYLMQIVVYDPRHMQAAGVISQATEGVQHLAKRCCQELGYCTARFGMTEQWNIDLQQATRHWLRKLSFPNADQILFCRSPQGKLETIAAHLHEQPQSVLLIDDMYEMLLGILPSLPTLDQEILSRHLTIGAYRAEVEQGEWKHSSVRVLPLPQWEKIQTFVEALAS